MFLNLENVAAQFCDSYCKYPKQYADRYTDKDEAWERLSIEKCETCPLVQALTEEVLRDVDDGR